MRRALFCSVALAAACLIGQAYAQIAPPGSASVSPQAPGPATVTPGGVGPGASLPSPVAPPAGIPLSAYQKAQDEAYSQQISSLQRKVEVLALKAQVAALQKKIADAQSPSQGAIVKPLIAEPPRAMDAQAATDASGQASTTVARVTVPEAPHPIRVAPLQPQMQLLGVLKVGHAAMATISAGGTPRRYAAGAALPFGWTLESIADTSVIVRRGRVHRRLTIGD